MTTAVAKPKAGQKRIMDMNKVEVEEYFAEATKQAQQEIHAKGLPYTIGDKNGIYAVFPNGRKVFTRYNNTENGGLTNL